MAGRRLEAKVKKCDCEAVHNRQRLGLSLSLTIAEFHASGGSWNADCEASGNVVACDLAPETAFGEWSLGTVPLSDKGNESPETATIVLVEGRICSFAVTLRALDSEVANSYQAARADYTTWVIENRPDRAAALIGHPRLGN